MGIFYRKTLPQKNVKSFLFFAQNIDLGNTLVPPLWGGSNEYPRSMF